MTKGRFPLVEAVEAARDIESNLAQMGAVSRFEVLGSIRRGKETVGDIELLVEPVEGVDIGEALTRAGVPRALPQNGRQRPWGPRYYCGDYLDARGVRTIQVDCFVRRDPAQWGVLELIRTGDAEFSHAMMKRLQQVGLRCKDGQIVVVDRMTYPWKTDTVACPDEATFFGLVALPIIPPRDRDWDREETRKRVEGP